GSVNTLSVSAPDCPVIPKVIATDAKTAPATSRSFMEPPIALFGSGSSTLASKLLQPPGLPSASIIRTYRYKFLIFKLKSGKVQRDCVRIVRYTDAVRLGARRPRKRKTSTTPPRQWVRPYDTSSCRVARVRRVWRHLGSRSD